MTPLGTLIFSVIGALAVAGVAAVIWWAMRDAQALTQSLQRDGWTVERPSGGVRKWSARRDRLGLAVSIEVTTAGVQEKSVWTHVRLAADTGSDDVLVERRTLAFLAADGLAARALGFEPPPRWHGGSPAFVADYTVYACDDSAAARWLSEANQHAILEYNRKAVRMVNVRFFNGAIEARWAAEPRDAAQLEGVVALLGQLRRR